MEKTCDMKNSEPLWNNVPGDILSLIKSRLFAKDLVCFNSVCKTWRSSPVFRRNYATELIKYPSLIHFHGENPSCNVYNPVYDNTFVLDIPELVGTQILFSKHGWLLASREAEMFFFQPCTKQRINLPDLNETANKYSFNRMCFSCAPTSPDCMVFGIVDTWTDEKEVYISFIRRGDDSWTSLTFPNKKRLSHTTPAYCKTTFLTSYNHPVFFRGAFYCLSEDGCLGVFDSTKRGDARWIILHRRNPCTDPDIENFLVEYNGELVSVFVGYMGEYVRVYKLNNWIPRSWKEVESLEDWMIFISHTSSISLSSPSHSSQVHGMENKIYFPKFHGGHSVFFSLSTCQFHSFQEDGYTAEDLENMKEYVNGTWFQPSFQLFSYDELDWLSANPVTYDQDQNTEDSFIRSLSFKTTARHQVPVLNRQEAAVSAHPWLVLLHGENDEMQTFFDVSKGCSYTRKIDELRGMSICCYREEWLVILSNKTSDCFLLNPTSMERILLPQWDSFHYDVCILTLSPDDPDCLVSFFGRRSDEAEEYGGSIMFCKVGDDKWTIEALSKEEENRRVLKVTSHNGKIYAFKNDSRLVIIEMKPSFRIIDVGVEPPINRIRGARVCDESLLESQGELVCLTMYDHGKSRREKHMGVQSISVFKMNFETMMWEEIKKLGDVTIFDSRFCSSSCCATESTFQGNTIYVLDRLHPTKLWSYDMEDGSLTVSLPCKDLENCSGGEFVMCRY
ncbi:uncharacterized protein LOC126657298 [Mercurialis annua]|uniref:uncharacterized protein LOC126657298 n=1 Tax=Mercurialis annua TaxID=3986 RepID=UPI0024AE46E6|nr:uncharacterized protein LOC126657298 [Mercurialis annua]